jgi:hypothetical protein
MDNNTYNSIPGVECIYDHGNPMLTSPYSEYCIGFFQTRESLTDVDMYRQFLKNVEFRVRKSETYRNYKSFLMDLGFDHCQIHGYINSTMATLEMHHAILTLFDIAMLITEHMLNTIGYVSTFDVVQAIKEEHKNGNVALVMLSKTPHDMYHADKTFFIHPDMCIGNWPKLLEKYNLGLTQDLAFHLLYYIKKAIDIGCTDDSGLLDLREKIMDWSNLK